MMVLKNLRLRRGWSQAELSRKANLNAGTISLTESRRFVPYPNQLAKLARALGVEEAHAHLLLEDTAPAASGEGRS